MNQLTFNKDGNTYAIKSDGTFTKNGQEKAGTWKCVDANDKLTLTEKAGAVLVVDVTYEFKSESASSRNLLVVKIAAAVDPAAPSEKFTGQIKIAQDGTITYALGATAEFKFKGELSFIDHFTKLQIKSGGKTTVINGNADLGFQETDRANEKDLLTFIAATVWKDEAGNRITKPAEIAFTGSLKMEQGILNFIGSFEGEKTVKLLMVGKYKFGSVGIQIGTEDGDFSSALVTRGSFEYKGATGTWDVALGYSKRGGITMSTTLGFEKKNVGNDGKSTIKGTATITYAKGQEIEVAAEFSGEISLQENRKLIFKIYGSNVGGALTFGLKGTVDVKGGKITFSLENGSGITTIELGFEGDKLTWSIKVLWGKKTPPALSFMVTYRFNAQGEQVPGPAKIAA